MTKSVLAPVIAGMSLGKKNSWNGDSLVGTIWKYYDEGGGCGYELFFASFDTVVCTELEREYVVAYRYDPPEVFVAWNEWKRVGMTDTGVVDPAGGTMVFEGTGGRIYYRQ